MKRITQQQGKIFTVLLISAVSLIACDSDQKHNYTIPDKICGAKIDPNLLEPLLPPGDEFEDYPWQRDSRDISCAINIDSRREFSMMTLMFDEPQDPVEAARNSGLATEVTPVDIADGGALWVGETTAGASVTFRCPQGGEVLYGLANLNFHGYMTVDSDDEQLEHIKDFARNYVDGIQQIECDT
jgi:hypothetical protein